MIRLGALAALLVLATACGAHGTKSTTTGQFGSALLSDVPSWAGAEGFTANHAALAGAKLFVTSGCLTCHTYLGDGSQELNAPDLSAEAALSKGVAFQVAHLKCPACVNPGSSMPNFATLGQADLLKLAQFLEASPGRGQ